MPRGRSTERNDLRNESDTKEELTADGSDDGKKGKVVKSEVSQVTAREDT